MATALGGAGADPSVGHCACLRRELSGEPDVGNLHLRFDEGRGTFSVPSYSTPRAQVKERAGRSRSFSSSADEFWPAIPRSGCSPAEPVSASPAVAE
jgi:hypothetical protein